MEVRRTTGGALLTVRVRTRTRPGLEVDERGVLVRVGAAPVQGRATEEARRILAGALGVPPRSVTLKAGARSTTKVFLITGLGPEDVTSRLR